MDTELLFYRIALKNLKEIGPIHARQLLELFQHRPADIFDRRKAAEIMKNGWPEKLKKQIESDDWRKFAEKELDFIQKNHIKAMWFEDDDYPLRLAQCPDAPLLLYQKGQADLNVEKVIAIVGTRKMTEYGKEATEDLISLLAQCIPGCMIISGLAFGVDACAHRCALKCALPTVAVLAHGLDIVYPRAHTSMANEMMKNGALISEMESGIQPEGFRFLQRNRIVAGLCDACVVIESGERGGSLTTARLARDYNREVYALPGRRTDIWSKGCNRLIFANTATILSSLKEFVSELAELPVPLPLNKRHVSREPELRPESRPENETIPLPENEKEIYQLFVQGHDYGLEQLTADYSMRYGKLIPAGELLALLFQLEIKQLLVSLPGNQFRLR